MSTASGNPELFSSPSVLVRTAIRVSRARWFIFLRRVFHHQNGSRSPLGSNPCNSATWMTLELVSLFVQISVSGVVLGSSMDEAPVWPMRIWIAVYNMGCFLSLILLLSRFRGVLLVAQEEIDVEQQRATQESRYFPLMAKCRTSLELFFAIWFVMGNVWLFDSRLGTFQRAPKLHMLCIYLLAWNALCYSFPFLLFLLLCCVVPLISKVLGYNMNKGSIESKATDDQILSLPRWRYKRIGGEEQECCICLTKYREEEEIRQLPCNHLFHLHCVDQWLRITSCCPLCKQGLNI